MHDFKSSPSFSSHRKKSSNKLWLSLSAIGVAGCVYWVTSTKEATPVSSETAEGRQTITVPIPLPPLHELKNEGISKKQNSPALPGTIAKIKPEPEKKTINWKRYTIKPGDSLSKIFNQLKLSASSLHEIVTNGDNKKHLKLIRPGEHFDYVVDKNGSLNKFAYDISAIKTLMISIADNEISSIIETKETTSRIKHNASTISDSLIHSAIKAGITERQAMELANLFGWDIDFALDLRAGDKFKMISEQQVLADGEIAKTTILAAEFTNQNKTYRAIRYTDPSGFTGYFTPTGKSIRKTFLRTPVKFARISSRFNLKRKHPILNKIRAHKGVDYAANRGTPIRATGYGKIVHRGRKGGYGKTVVIQHGNKYSTLYAHMSSFKRGLKMGSSVKQGDVIGYIGMTGLATGPHLHYEFRVNGVHRDPLRVKLPQAKSIKKAYIEDFTASSEPLLDQLTHISKTFVASNP
jgi:murein DD-endopeptidase MepM/ murein hydrolase activator NlpD